MNNDNNLDEKREKYNSPRIKLNVKLVPQRTATDCGAACVSMCIRYFEERLVSPGEIVETAKKLFPDLVFLEHTTSAARIPAPFESWNSEQAIG